MGKDRGGPWMKANAEKSLEENSFSPFIVTEVRKRKNTSGLYSKQNENPSRCHFASNILQI